MTVLAVDDLTPFMPHSTHRRKLLIHPSRLGGVHCMFVHSILQITNRIRGFIHLIGSLFDLKCSLKEDKCQFIIIYERLAQRMLTRGRVFYFYFWYKQKNSLDPRRTDYVGWRYTFYILPVLFIVF